MWGSQTQRSLENFKISISKKINKISINSKEIEKNDLFVGLKGKIKNGNIFADNAIKNGALGGKISGAGGGGFIYFLCPPEHQKKMIKSINEVQYINCKLIDKGSEIIYER